MRKITSTSNTCLYDPTYCNKILYYYTNSTGLCHSHHYNFNRFLTQNKRLILFVCAHNTEYTTETSPFNKMNKSDHFHYNLMNNFLAINSMHDVRNHKGSGVSAPVEAYVAHY